MAHIIREIVVKNAQGLHARPAAMFVQIASRYNSNVTLSKDDEKVNGKSIMGILTLGVQPEARVILEADGDDAQEMVVELEQLLTKDVIV